MKNLIVTFIFLIFSAVASGQNPKLKIAHLTGDFYVFTTYKSFQGNPFPSNGMYVVTDAGVVMIDTPWDTTQFQPLLDSIQRKHHKNVVMCVATHSHEDRTGGIDYYRQKGIKTYTTKQTDKISAEKKEKRAEFLIGKDTTFAIGQHVFKTYYGGEGHAPDNIVVWFEKEKVLYGGCLIKSTDAVNLGNLADANVNAWKTTLHHVQQQCPNPKYVIPGHQSWKSNRSIEHTLELIAEKQKEK